MWRGDLTEGFFALQVWGAYIWGGLYMEGLIFGILRYFIEEVDGQPLREADKGDDSLLHSRFLCRQRSSPLTAAENRSTFVSRD